MLRCKHVAFYATFVKGFELVMTGSFLGISLCKIMQNGPFNAQGWRPGKRPRLVEAQLSMEEKRGCGTSPAQNS